MNMLSILENKRGKSSIKFNIMPFLEYSVKCWKIRYKTCNLIWLFVFEYRDELQKRRRGITTSQPDTATPVVDGATTGQPDPNLPDDIPNLSIQDALTFQ